LHCKLGIFRSWSLSGSLEESFFHLTRGMYEFASALSGLLGLPGLSGLSNAELVTAELEPLTLKWMQKSQTELKVPASKRDQATATAEDEVGPGSGAKRLPAHRAGSLQTGRMSPTQQSGTPPPPVEHASVQRGPRGTPTETKKKKKKRRRRRRSGNNGPSSESDSEGTGRKDMTSIGTPEVGHARRS